MILVVRMIIIYIPYVRYLFEALYVLLFSFHLISLSKLIEALTCDLLITLDGCFLYDKEKDMKIELLEELTISYQVDSQIQS